MSVPIFTHGSLFSGIGGFDLAAEWMGWINKFHCEWNPFGQKVLKHYWPHAKSYEDITKTDFTLWRGLIDLLSGGFPCQPYSAAGKRLGKEDERHLWPEMLRAIREIQPVYVVGENVRGITNWNGGLVFDEVQADLEAEGFEIIPFLLPAAGVNAPHERYRIWFIAYSKRNDDLRKERRGNGSAARVQEIDWPQYGNTGEFGGADQFSVKRIEQNKCAAPNADGFGSVNRREQPLTDQQGINIGCNSAENVTNNKSQRLERHRRSSKISKSELPSVCNHEGNSENDVSDTDCSGRRESNKADAGGPSEQLNGGNIQQNDADSLSDRQQGRREPDRPKEAGRQVIEPFTQHARNDWQDFPSQSPICHGNDGFSAQLDGITFSKWRNESIKAGGNAIVPQEAYQIFKAIDAYEKIKV